MPFQVMQQLSSRARFKWLEEEYVDALTWLYFVDTCISFGTDISEQRIQLQILADSMGLGKTIMTISLLLTCSERDGSLSSSSTSQSPKVYCEASSNSDKSPIPQKKPLKFAGFQKLMKKRAPLLCGGNLIVCPMTLIGQWKV